MFDFQECTVYIFPIENVTKTGWLLIVNLNCYFIFCWHIWDMWFSCKLISQINFYKKPLSFSFVTGVCVANCKGETIKKQRQFNKISVLILTHNILDSHLEALSRKQTRSRCLPWHILDMLIVEVWGRWSDKSTHRWPYMYCLYHQSLFFFK